VTGDGVVGDTVTKTALVVRLMEQHVNPSTVLLGPRLVCFPGPFLEEGVADLPINMLLLALLWRSPTTSCPHTR